MDPNWFYSTLAQSSAAFLGILGGFLTSRLMAELSNARTEAARLERAYWSGITKVVTLGWKPKVTSGLLIAEARHLQEGGARYKRIPSRLLKHLEGWVDAQTEPSPALPDWMMKAASFLEKVGDWSEPLMPREIVTDPATKREEKQTWEQLTQDYARVTDEIRRARDLPEYEKEGLLAILREEWDEVIDFWMLNRGVQEDYARFTKGLETKPYYVGFGTISVLFLLTVLLPMLRLAAWAVWEKTLFTSILGGGIIAFLIYTHVLIQQLPPLRRIWDNPDTLAVWEAARPKH